MQVKALRDTKLTAEVYRKVSESLSPPNNSTIAYEISTTLKAIKIYFTSNTDKDSFVIFPSLQTDCFAFNQQIY